MLLKQIINLTEQQLLITGINDITKNVCTKVKTSYHFNLTYKARHVSLMLI
jgi:hypothetical protein